MNIQNWNKDLQHSCVLPVHVLTPEKTSFSVGGITESSVRKMLLDAENYQKKRDQVAAETKSFYESAAKQPTVSSKVDKSDMSDVSDMSNRVEQLEGDHDDNVNVKTSGAEKVEKTSEKGNQLQFLRIFISFSSP